MMCVAVLVPSVVAAVSAFVALGVLLATVVPSAFSLSAGVTGVSPAWTISQLTTVGYAGTFIGPVLIGLVAGVSQLTIALLMPAALLLLHMAGGAGHPRSPGRGRRRLTAETRRRPNLIRALVIDHLSRNP